MINQGVAAATLLGAASLGDRVDIESVRTRAQERVAAVRAWALRMLDVVPGLQRLVNDLVRIEVIDRAMVIAAQGLLALVPLLIVLASFLPADVAAALVERFEAVSGLGPSDTQSVHTTLTADQVRTQTGAVGLVLTLFSATSFARAIQRMYERTWQKRHVGGIRGARRCFLWLIAWLVLLQAVSLLGRAAGEGLGSVSRVVVQAVAGTLLWTWTMRLLLLGRVPWRLLLPGALITSLGSLVYTGASSVVMPRYVATSAEQLGVLGLVLAATTWLIGFAFLMVVAAVLGRVLAEDERIHAAVSLVLLRGRRRAREELEHEQHEQRAPEHDEREGAGRVGRKDVDE